VTLNFVLH